MEKPWAKTGTQYNRALQDLVNVIGRKLEFEVQYGRYKGIRGEIGYDGLWKSPLGKFIVVETKTTSAFQIDTQQVMSYIQDLDRQGQVKVDDTVGLYVVGRFDATGLENNIRGAGLVSKLRVISCDDLLDLFRLKEEMNLTHSQVLTIMLPFDNVNIGELLSVIKAVIPKPEVEEEAIEEEKEVIGREGRVTIKDLIDEGIIMPGLKLQSTYKGETYEAEIRPDGTILYNGKRYRSPSGAGQAVIGYACDGWYHWKYLDPESNEWEAIAKLRAKLTGRMR